MEHNIKEAKSTSEPSTLIIWEEVPENTRFFLVPNTIIDTEFVSNLHQANDRFVNTVGWRKNKGLNFLKDWLFDEDGDCKKSEFEVNSQVDKLVFDNVVITRVCHAGFIL
jgi:hypothetical protein